jgi:hypothetical protein
MGGIERFKRRLAGGHAPMLGSTPANVKLQPAIVHRKGLERGSTIRDPM